MTPKLRDSCDNCATAKVKCNKEKPYCLRCRDRGIRCEYGESRRTGRTKQPNASSSSSTHRREEKRRPSETPTTISASGTEDDWSGIYSSTPSLDLNAMDLGHQTPMNVAPTAIMSTGSSIATEVTGDYGNGLFDLPTDPGLLPDLEENTCRWDYTAIPPMWTISNDFQGKENVQAQTSCFVEALNHLRLLSSADDGCASCKLGSWSQSPAASFEEVSASAKNVLQALKDMMDCSCSLNGNMITLLFLIMLKLVSRYAAVAFSIQQSSSSSLEVDGAESSATLHSLLRELPPDLSRLFAKGKQRCSDSGSAGTQHVLDELYQIQELNKMISRRVDEACVDGRLSSMEPTNDEWRQSETAMAGSLPVSLLTAEIAKQYATSLTKSLRAVSFQVVQILVQQ